MRAKNKRATEQEWALMLNRSLRDLRFIAAKSKRSRMTPLQVCEAIIEKRVADGDVRSFFYGPPVDERQYWIASLYALRMPTVRRRRLAAYFILPHLAHHTIDALVDAGECAAFDEMK